MTGDSYSAAVDRGEEAKKQKNDKKAKRTKEDKIDKIRTGGYNTPWTIVGGVKLATICFFRNKNGAVPHPDDSTEQIDHWENQRRLKLGPCQRTLLMDTTGCPAGTKTHSPSINIMATEGKTEAVAKERKQKGIKKTTEMLTGRNQTNDVESCAICLLISFCRLMIDTFDCLEKKIAISNVPLVWTV